MLSDKPSPAPSPCTMVCVIFYLILVLIFPLFHPYHVDSVVLSLNWRFCRPFSNLTSTLTLGACVRVAAALHVLILQSTRSERAQTRGHSAKPKLALRQWTSAGLSGRLPFSTSRTSRVSNPIGSQVSSENIGREMRGQKTGGEHMLLLPPLVNIKI
jgi:hypothetical protein